MFGSDFCRVCRTLLVLCHGLILGWPGSNEVSPRNQLTGGSLRSTPATPILILRCDEALDVFRFWSILGRLTDQDHADYRQ